LKAVGEAKRRISDPAEGVAPNAIRRIGSGSVEFAGPPQEARRVEIRIGK
jgi:hypothetical protein